MCRCLWNILVVCVALGASAGCHHTASIPPQQLPMLNGTYERQVGSTSTTVYRTDATGHTSPTTRVDPIVERSVRHVITTDGRTVEVQGEVTATVVPVGSQPRTFEHPVISTVTPQGVLEVRGSNRPVSQIPLTQVERVDLRWSNPVGTSLAITGISVGIAAVALGVFFAAQ